LEGLDNDGGQDGTGASSVWGQAGDADRLVPHVNMRGALEQCCKMQSGRDSGANAVLAIEFKFPSQNRAALPS
jgi:hypothetical protein